MKFSIITINYNNVDGLSRTINSVISQKCADYEFIIIDGGSTDGSLDLLHAFSSSISYWVSEPDRGIYHAMNKGISVSRGEYLLFLNSGDFFFDDHVLLNVAKQNIWEDIICGATCNKGEIKYSPEEITLGHFIGASMFHQSSFIKRDLHLCLLYDETLKICSDVKFFMQALVIKTCTYRSIDVVISEYEGGGVSEMNFALLEDEKRIIWDELIPMRIQKDYQLNYEKDFRRLMFKIEKSNFRKIIYSINVFIIKFFKFFSRTHWIFGFSLREHR